MIQADGEHGLPVSSQTGSLSSEKVFKDRNSKTLCWNDRSNEGLDPAQASLKELDSSSMFGSSLTTASDVLAVLSISIKFR